MDRPGGGARVVEHHGVDGPRADRETRRARTGRLGGIALALLLALVTPACESARPGGSTASPGRLDEVGDEVVVGKNRTGENCRIRFAFKGRWGGDPYERLDLYCEGWTQPSGHILRSRFSPQYPPAQTLTTGPIQQNFSSRLGDCGEIEATSLGDGTAAVLRECKRIQGGWPMLVVAAHAGLKTYVLETFPTNLPLLELAVNVLRGQRLVEGPAGGSARMSAAIRRAETMVGASGRLLGIQDVGAHATLTRLGTLRLYAGDDVASEEAFRRALEIEERVSGPDHPSSGWTLTMIARNAAVLRKSAEAERLFARAEPLVQRSFVADHYPLYLTHRAQALRIGGKAEESLALALRAAQTRESARNANGASHSLYHAALALRVLGRPGEAERVAGRALAFVDRPGPDAEFRAWWVGTIHDQLGWIYVDQKRFADARSEFEQALERYRLLFGDSVRTAAMHGAIGRVGRLEGDIDSALRAFRHATAIAARDRLARSRARPDGLADYLDTLLDAAAAAPDQRQALLAEGFVAAQLPQGNETAKAVTTMSSRLATADPAIQAATRQYQEAARERERLRQALALETLKEARDAKREETLKAQFRAAEDLAATLEVRLQEVSPRYARLTAAAPLGVAEITLLLRPDEAVLAFLVTGRATYVFVVRDGRVYLHRAPIAARALETEIRKVRASVTLADGQLRTFDVVTAQRLFELLIAPVADGLAGARHLVTVPAGPLLSVPLGLFVTRPPSRPPGEDYREVAWLARTYAVSVLPSVTALRDLRATAVPSAARHPFIGFGDPAFTGSPGDTRGLLALATACRQGESMDVEIVRGLPRLRETSHELTRIASALGAGPDSLVLGSQATKSRVREIDLDQYRVIAFATHGLLPAELRCRTEPALALTPGASGSAGDDGLLGASEVAQLRLDADWVVLSACNTAAADGSLGGESLSGLARGFFYAGARALLVSHWAVVSQSTVTLTTGLFDIYGRDPSLGRAEALRRAQMALWEERKTSHPVFWAPFVLIGDGGSRPGATAGLPPSER